MIYVERAGISLANQLRLSSKVVIAIVSLNLGQFVTIALNMVFNTPSHTLGVHFVTNSILDQLLNVLRGGGYSYIP